MTIICTCCLSAPPVPTTACLTCEAVYSATLNPSSIAATMAAPRACPSFRAESALRAMNTCSMLRAVGPWVRITSRTLRNTTCRRSCKGPLPVRIHPDATYSQPRAVSRTTPKPVMREPGSIPRIKVISWILKAGSGVRTHQAYPTSGFALSLRSAQPSCAITSSGISALE